MTRNCFKEGQNICDVRPGPGVFAPTPLRQHPYIFRETKDLPVLRSLGALAIQNHQRYKERVNLRERSFLCENLQERSFRSDSPQGAIISNLIDNHPERIDVRLLRWIQHPIEQLRCHPLGSASPNRRSHRNAGKRVLQYAREAKVGNACSVIAVN